MQPKDVGGRVLAGDRRAVARAISMVEDGSDALPALSAELYPRTGHAWTLGLTGSPGVGKSSLAEQIVKTVRALGRTVAVLAIDPTSPFTGGALLGDRVRMQAHATDPGVFIRSMATRGHLGGMALAAPEAIRVLDASGKDLVIVETVGVGQSEVEVAAATDTTVVAVAPGWGDAVQASKAGILEIADVFVVNKADRDGAAETVRDLRNMLRMGPRTEWEPPIVKTSTVTGDGISELWEAVERHRSFLTDSGELERRRSRRILTEVEAMVAERLRARASGLLRSEALDGLAAALAERSLDPYAAADQLMAQLTM
ncbi:MAG TPA: methylmalonyl Co-A mutase-associated GTPase MeaB [Actinobacteria bacterium]|jgi:LAO/AO transport system kinase|nr:methylmalonyl Co-A mutase-associated GTPase MeaB [Actinomycetota bacterium]